MENNDKTKDQIFAEMEEMCKKLQLLEICRREFQVAQKQHEKLLESTPDAMLFVNSEGRIVRTNARIESLFGYTQAELDSAKLEILIPERFRDMHRKHMSSYFLQPRTRLMGHKLNIVGLRKDGSEFPADISLSPLLTDGELLVIAAIRDITERKKTELQIERNYHVQRVINSILKLSLNPSPLEEQLQLILDLILSVPLMGFQSVGSIYLVGDNPQMLEMKANRGLQEQQTALCANVPFGKCLCGRAAEAQVIEYADGVDDRHEIFYEGMEPHGHYCVPVVSDTKSVGLISIFLKEGQQRTPEAEEFLIAVSNTLAGIIERKRAEAALKESEEKYRSLVENVNIGVYRNTGGPHGRFLQANPALAKIFGYESVDEIMQIAVSDLYQRPEERKYVIAEVLEKGFVKDRELRLKKKDGTPIWAAFTARAQFDDKGKLKWFDGVVEDITERKRAEDERQQLQEQLHQAEKLSALGRLASNVAHEIRNPLTVIGGFARRLEKVSTDIHEREYAGSIIAEVNRLERILKSVLTLSNQIKPELLEYHIRDIIDEALKTYEKTFTSKSILVSTSFSDLPPVFVNKDQIFEAVDCLISNAVEAMPEGGSLTIETTDFEQNGRAFIAVKFSDTGLGIPEERLGRIYEPFFTTKVAERGPGLGLPITKKIVEDHGGFMRAESIVGKGSSFSIYIPYNRK